MKEEKPIPSAFFTEIDAIFDTRLGTLLQMSKNKEAKIDEFLDNGRYFTRDRDLFKGVNPDLFKERYRQRNKETLKVSLMTKMVSFIFDFGKYTHESNIKTPFLKEPKLIINLHPYHFTEDEKALLIEGLRMRTGKIHSITLVNMAYEEITPRYLKQETAIIALYDPYEWLETHAVAGNFKNQSCPNVMMLGPLRLRNLDETTPDMKKFQKDMEMLAKPFVDLELMVTTVFSANIITATQQKSTHQKDPQAA